MEQSSSQKSLDVVSNERAEHEALSGKQRRIAGCPMTKPSYVIGGLVKQKAFPCDLCRPHSTRRFLGEFPEFV